MLKEVNQELDRIFNKPSFNQILTGSIWRSSTYKDVSLPLSLKSINILELCIDLFNEFVPEDKKAFYVISNVHIFSETSKKIVPWHSDQLKNIMKLNVLLRGGGIDSGEFQYIKGSNRIDHEVLANNIRNDGHHLSTDEFNKLSKFCQRFPASPGDVLQFDSYGFHFRGPCTKERRNIFIEIQDIRDSYNKGQFFLRNELLTDKVCKNIHIFRADSRSIYQDYYTNHTAIPLHFLKCVFFMFVKINLKKLIKRFSKI